MMPVTVPPAAEHGAGHRTHEAVVAAPVDEADARLGHGEAERLGGRPIMAGSVPSLEPQ